MFKLKEAIISITNQCNLRCRMCDIPKNPSEELDTQEWKRIIGEIADCSAQTVVFSGGEPLLRKDLFELIAFAKGRGMNVCVTSNGYLLDREKAGQLANCGINVVNISLEGPKEIHDHLRGKGAFDKAIQALQALRDNNIESTVATVVSRHNFGHLDYIVEQAKNNFVTTVKFQPFNTLFLETDIENKRNEFLINRQDMNLLEGKIKEALFLCRKYCISTNPENYFKNMALFLSGKFTRKVINCNAVSTSCPINARGQVYPCWQLATPGWEIGSVKNENFSKIWSGPRHKEVAEKIKSNGCSGCLMSCYDQIFGDDTIEKKISKHIKMANKNGYFRHFISIFKRWKDKVVFYSSYRGSFRQIFQRFKKISLNKFSTRSKLSGNDNFAKAFQEIGKAKEILKKELGQF